tara:strand:+ start:567 stop:758 length:192 start_codon:yes stop_codon:yes gene_type:complete
MKVLNYIHASELTPASLGTVIPGEHISIKDMRYERVSVKPHRRKLLRKLINEGGDTEIRLFGI